MIKLQGGEEQLLAMDRSIEGITLVTDPSERDRLRR